MHEIDKNINNTEVKKKKKKKKVKKGRKKKEDISEKNVQVKRDGQDISLFFLFNFYFSPTL